MLLSTFVVTSAADTLTKGLPTQGTLRWAIGQAEAATTPSTVAFALGSSPSTIKLTQGQLVLNKVAQPITIVGPGASLLSVSGGGKSRVFAEYGSNLTLENLTVTGGSADRGGGLRDSGGSLTAIGCTVSGNDATSDGGGIYSQSSSVLDLIGCTISGNTALKHGNYLAPGLFSGGGLFNVNATATLTGCVVQGNSAYLDGGGIYNGGFNSTGTTILSGCTISGNTAKVGGGLASAGSSATITTSTFQGNSATYGGGAHINSGTAIVTGSTFLDNTAKTLSGGLDVGGAATVTDCTFSGNTSPAGGGVQAYGGGNLALVANTISGNSSTQSSGGGLRVLTLNGKTPTVSLVNTIVAGNTGSGGTADDIGGTVPFTVTGNHNLVGTGGSGGLMASNNLLNVAQAGLTALGSYGGPTQTVALLPGSPAIGAGVAVAGQTTDQRGFGLDSPPDIGAFQVQSSGLLVNTASDGVGSPLGTLSLREAVNLAGSTGGGTITFDPLTFGQSSTITLLQGQIALNSTSAPVTIVGPGAGLLSVSGGGKSRVFAEYGGNLTLEDLTVTGGSADRGGGLRDSGGSLTAIDCTVSGNTATSNGGGIYSQGGSTLDLIGCTISTNTAPSGSGGGLLNDGTAATLTGCVVRNNSAANSGGGIDAAGNATSTTLDGCDIAGNTSGRGGSGGGLFVFSGTATITSSTFQGNTAGIGGGGLAAFSSTVTVTTSTFQGNTAFYGGAAEILYGTANLSGSTLQGNTATREGGGLDVNSSVTLTDCTLSGNTSPAGGGVRAYAGAALTLVASTISGNSSTQSAGGGLELLTAYGSTPLVSLVDTIVAGNTGVGGAADDIEGTAPATGNHNLVGTGGSGGLDPSDNLLGVANPGLSALGSYGGPTQTIALLPGSPAIGAGVAVAGLTTDQRGFGLDSPPDIGGFQVQAVSLVVNTVSDGPGPGELSLRQAVSLAGALGGGTITFDPAVFSTPQTITLTQGQIEPTPTAKPTDIEGPGAGLVTVSGGGVSRVFQVDSGVTLNLTNLTITDGLANTGGGFNHRYGYGGGFYQTGGTLTLADCTISGNTATRVAGGIFEKEGSLTLIDSDVIGNDAEFGPGIEVSAGASASISGCTLSKNTGYGGNALDSFGTVVLQGCVISDNNAPNLDGNGVVGPSQGGAIYEGLGTLTLTDCTITGNSAGAGGAIEANSDGDRIGVALTTLILTDCTLSGNSTRGLGFFFGYDGGNGGAVGEEALYDGTVNLSFTGCTISGNSAGTGTNAAYGGAISTITEQGCYTNLSMTDCTVSANSAAGPGGALSLDGGTTILTGCTFSGNTANGNGGAVLQSAGSLAMVDCTISGNTAAQGGGIYSSGYQRTYYNYYYGVSYTTTYPATLSLTACTVSGNSGGGLNVGSYGTATVVDTIVAANIGPADPLDIDGSGAGQVTGTNNLIGTGGSGGLDPSDNLLGVADPGLSALGDYGGPTQTIALLPGSPAIGTGVAVAGLTTDQRGFGLDSPPDIGAFQVQADSLVVTTPSDAGVLGKQSLRGAIDLAGALGGGTVTFDPAVFSTPQTITLTKGQIEPTASGGTITVESPGANLVTVSGGGVGRVFQVDPGVTLNLSGLTIADGLAQEGGGIYQAGGSLTLDGCTVTGNSATSGGGIFEESGTLALVDCTISGNVAGATNQSGYGGGLDVNSSGSASITGGTFTDNIATVGGGIANYGSLTLQGCLLSGNTGRYYYANFGYVSGVQLSEGGAIDNGGTLTATGCTLTGNAANLGGAIANSGSFGKIASLTLTDCNLSDNTVVSGQEGFLFASGEGGALYLSGFFSNSVAAVTGCTISGNTAIGGYYNEGGGIATYAFYGSTTLTLTDCSITGNASGGTGGGLYAFGGNVTLTACTVAGNQAASDGGGLEIIAGTLALTSCTITDNSAAGQGGGLNEFVGSATLTDTIIAANTGPAGASDIDGQVSGSYNLIGTGGTGGLTTADHNLLNVADPGLGTLGYYGGPTETIPLLPGSPAIDAGNNALDVDPTGNPLTTDQRGLPRVVNGTVDIGAFESSGFTISLVPASETTQVGTAFSGALEVVVTPVHAGDPVGGGVISLSVPGSGASATLSSGTITLNSAGTGSVTATANGTAGTYTIGVSAAGSLVVNPGGPAGFKLTNTAAQLATVSAVSVAWGSDSAKLFFAADGLRLLPAGRNTDLPWLGIQSITLTLSGNIALTPSEISVTGINIADYGPVTITRNGSSYTITLARPIGAADRITLSINAPGLAPFTGELDVLPGDVGDAGVVNAVDLVLERDFYLGILIPNLPDEIFGDILGDGMVDVADYNAVRARVGTTLPPRR